MLQINISMKQKQTHWYREQTHGLQRRGGRRWRDSLGVSRCKRSQHREQMSSGVPECSGGNHIQHPLGSHNMRKDACLCITGSLCCTAEVSTTLWINYTWIKFLKKCFQWEAHLRSHEPEPEKSGQHRPEWGALTDGTEGPLLFLSVAWSVEVALSKVSKGILKSKSKTVSRSVMSNSLRSHGP